MLPVITTMFLFASFLQPPQEQNVVTGSQKLQNLDPNFKADKLLRGSGPGEPKLLESMVLRADMIVVGRMLGIVRHAHTPMNSEAFFQHTVYAFQVAQAIKGQPTKIIKIYQEGGPLSWEFHNSKGIGMRIEGDPFYKIGSTYILFLDSAEKLSSPPEGKNYLMASFNGVSGKAREMDEYSPISPYRAKILLDNGLTTSPDKSTSWQFIRGPQIMDRPELEAIQEIQKSLKALEERQKNP
jgi:hypothetical protein